MPVWPTGGIKYTWEQIVYKISTGEWSLEQALKNCPQVDAEMLRVRLRYTAGKLWKENPALQNAAKDALEKIAEKNLSKKAAETVAKTAVRTGLRKLSGRAVLRVGGRILLGVAAGATIAGTVFFTAWLAYDIYKAVHGYLPISSIISRPQLIKLKGDITSSPPVCTDGSTPKLSIEIKGTAIEGECDFTTYKRSQGIEITYHCELKIKGTFNPKTGTLKGIIADGKTSEILRLPSPITESPVEHSLETNLSGTWSGTFKNGQVKGISNIKYDITKKSDLFNEPLMQQYLAKFKNKKAAFVWKQVN